jgi:hypothetical protein
MVFMARAMAGVWPAFRCHTLDKLLGAATSMRHDWFSCRLRALRPAFMAVKRLHAYEEENPT